MSALLTTEEVRKFVVTKLENPSLEILIEAADAQIISGLGPHPPAGSGSLVVEVAGQEKKIVLGIITTI